MNQLYFKIKRKPVILAISMTMIISALSMLPTTIADDNDFDIIKTFQETIPEIQFGKGSIDIDTAIINAANYLVHAQADITEDNAGNGNPDVPDDPDDGGWDWISTTFTHSTAASPTNIYGATATGLYYAYLETNDATYKTALDDAAGYMITDSEIDSASDLVFLMLYDDLPTVSGTTYQDAAKTKYDTRIATYGNATAFAEYIRDARATSYPNGIIAWDIGSFVKVAAMLHDRYPTGGYDTDAADIAEVIWQDSFNDNPGYFDVIDNQGFDPTYANVSYYWYTLGITGLIDAFYSAQVHTSEISGLVSILLECQYPNGAFSFSYGANQYDEDWQSAAYAVNSLALVDFEAYQTEINHACYWLYSTQDQTSGGWVYSSGNHYPEIGGECTSALYFEEEILEVTQPVQITTNQSYERGQSITFDGTNYWMFYGRSEDCNESYGSGNPDVNDYVLYYEKASSIEGLGQGSKGQVGIPVDDIYLGETGAAYLDGKVWVFAPVDVGTTCSLYGYYTDDDGATWYESGPYVSDMSDGQAHHDEIVFDGELWILEGSGDYHTKHSSTPTNEASFSTPLQIGASESLTGGLGHFFVDDTDLYLALGSGGSYYIYWYDDTGISWELVASKTISGYYDPFLFKVDDHYIFAAAPYTGGRQWIVCWTSTSIDSGFFDGRELSIIEGRYGSNVWVDMWPIGYTDDDGDTFLFFTSERNPDDTNAEIDGNIWYLKYDWDPLNDHYTYIQEAVDEASGTIIKVAAGTYKEEVYIYKSLTLLGPNAGIHGTSTARNPEAIIRLPDGLTGPGGYWGVPVYIDADDVTLDGFTISDEGYETSVGFDYFTGIASAYKNNTVITNNIVEGFNYTSIFTYHSYPAELPIDGIQITDNLVIDNVGLYHAIYVQGVGGTVTGNTVDNCGGAIQIQPYSQPNGGFVTNNVLKGYVNGIYFNYANKGSGTWIIEGNDISLAAAPIGSKGNGHPEGNIIDLSPIDMIDTKSGYNWSGLYLRTHGNSGTGTAPDVSFIDNVIDGSGATDPYWDEIRAVQIRNIHETSLATFYSNNFTNADVGVFIYDDGNVDNVEFTQNNFLGNTDGIENTNSYVLEATCNWWGDISGPSGYGPGTGDSVTENVDFMPWLDDAYPYGDCTIDCVDIMYVDDDASPGWYDWDHVSSIQTAVDRLCEGGTIYISSGTYTEDIAINKSLTMIGSGDDQTFIKSTSSTPLITITSNNVTIQNLELTNDIQLAEGIQIDSGASMGLVIHSVDITNLGAGTGANAYGIRILNGFTDLSVLDCDFISVSHTTYYRTIGIFAPNNLDLNDFEVHDSTFNTIWTGIYLRSAINGLDVMNNIFQDQQLSDNGGCAAGIYIGDGSDYNFDIENIEIAENTFTNFNRGIYVWNYANDAIIGSFDIHDNTFTDSIWSSPIRFIAGLSDDEDVSYIGPITIDNNEFTQNSDIGANVALIDFRSYCSHPSCQIEVTNNNMTFSGGSYVDAMYGIKFSAYADPFTNTLIEYNTLNGDNTGGAGTIPSSGVVIDHYASTEWPTDTLEMDIFHNNLIGFDNGVSIYDLDNAMYGGLPTGSILNVNYNNIYDNALYGIRNNNSEIINAECNWWGDSSGPSDAGSGIGDAVTANVDFLPWLDKAFPDGDCVGGTCADPVWVDDDASSGWYDWDHCATIQTALDRVCVGGTVYVASGDYVENIVVDKSVNLIGDGRDTTIVHNSGDISQVYTMKIDGNQPGLTGDVVVEGLTFTGNYGWNATVTTDHIPSGITITFQNNRINDSFLYGWWDYHSHGNLEMHNNIVSNVEYGLMFEGWDTGTINIGNNDFQLIPGYFGYPAGMFHFTYSYLNCTNPYNIYENTFSTSAPGYGVVFYAGYGGSYDAAQYTDVTIVDNEFNAIGYYGVFLRNYGPVDQNGIGGVHNAFIAYNNFTDCSRAVLVYDNNSDIIVNYNNFIDTPYLDIKEDEISEYTGPLSHVSFPEVNTFDITDYGIQNTGIYEVDGTCNWWGDATGPYHSTLNPTGLGCNVSDFVAFLPWLDDVYPNGDCSGGAIVHNLDSDEWFSTIQEAIDDTDTVNGDTLEIIATTHAEGPQIVISKDLTITGQGCSSTIIVPTGNTGGSGDARGWWLVNDGIELHLSDLKLDGTGYDIYQGIRHKGDGTIDQVCFQEMKYPGYGGVAVAAFGGGPVDITNCQFSEIGRVGVLYWVTNSLFEGNTYVGKGDGDWLDYCLDIGGGGGVSVIDNTISGCTGVASSDGSESAGILVTTLYAPGTYATIEENDISDCIMAIAVGYDTSDTSSVTANNNNFFNCEWGITSTAPLVDGTCNWWGDILGPYHDDDNPMGIGCNVSDNVAFIPWLDDGYPYGDCNGYPGLLNADFDYNPNNPSAYETVAFTDQSTVTGATIVNWSWTFGDGDNSYQENPTHQYTADGKYPVTLTVTDDLGHTDTISKLVPVGPIQLASLVGNYWNIISLPFNESVNKNDILIKYDNAFYSWSQAVSQELIVNFIYSWNESIQSYQFASTLEPGKGYWVFAYVNCELWVDEVTAPSDTLITDVGAYWNLIGLPFDQSVDKVDVIVRYDNIDHTWNEAVTDGVVVNFVYGWNAAIQSYQFANTFIPGYGYWLFAYQPCRLKQTI